MALNARDAFNSALSLFSSLYEDMNPTDLPEGLSPDNQDVWFLPGSVSTRPALSRHLSTPVGGAPEILSVEDYPVPNGTHLGVFLDSNGALWQRNPDGTKTQLTSVYGTGIQFKAENAFSKQFYAFYNATMAAAFSQTPFVGVDIPRYFDGSNVWRVTQDAPGAPPTISTVSIPAATIQGAGVPVTVNIANSPNGIVWNGSYYYPYGGGGYWWRWFTVTTTTPHGLSVGNTVTISGSTSTPSVNGTWLVESVGSSTTFTVQHQIPQSSAVNGGGGTIGQTSGSGTSLTRSANSVLAVTSAAHGFQAGWQVQIAGIGNTNLGGGISSISRDGNGIVTVVTASAHGLQVGMPFAITGVTNPDSSFNGNFTVATVISSTSFTYELVGLPESSTGGSGNVQDIWIGKFIITSVPSTTSFTYFQLGPNDTTSAVGTATIVPLMAAGPRSAVVMFKSANGAITAPSIPVQFTSDGVNLISAVNIPIGPDGTAQRIIAFTPAFGANFYYLTPSFVPTSAGQPEIFQPGTIINDNTTTSVILDFADTALTAGTQIDTTGNNLFNQVVLAPCLGVLEYQGRLCWWGEVNNLKNLINMGFDGGYTTQTTTDRAGSGANDGGAGTAWTNPNNVTSASSYADLSLAAFGSSQNLLCKTFSFALGSDPSSLTVSFETYGAIVGAGSLLYTVQLLKAGTPFGTPQTLIMPVSAGSSGAPLVFSTTFRNTGLTASDVNNANFGVQIQVVEFEVAATSTCHIRNVQISAVTPNLQPLGWLSFGSSGGTGILVDLGNPGFGFQMTSNGGATDCLIYQPFYQDFYGAPIPLPGRQYLARLVAKTSNADATGFLVIEVAIGPGLNLYIAKIPISSLGTSFGWAAHAISALPSVPDPGWNLNIYLQNVTAGTVVTIDEVSIVDSLQPVLSQQLRASYFGNEFGYDLLTGVIGLSSYTAGQITGCFEQRGTLYALTDQSHGDMIRIQNNGSTEPFEWPVDRFAQNVDCAGPSAVDTGEGVSWWAGQSGLRIFSGDQPKKISQERQPTWDRINWTGTLSLFVKNDPVERMLYVGLPLDANTSVSEVEPMSYRSVNTALEPADPLHISFSAKLICSDLCRKWTRWGRALHCAAMLTGGNSAEIVFGGGFGYLYALDFTKFTDDDYGTIPSYYTTYFHWNHEMEQGVPELGLHRKIYTYLSIYVTGIGKLTITPLVDSLGNPWQPKTSTFNTTTGLWESGSTAAPLSQQLSTQLDHDLDWRLNVLGDRVAFKIAPAPLQGQTDAYFNLQHLVVAGRMDRVMPVRGAFI